MKFEGWDWLTVAGVRLEKNIIVSLTQMLFAIKFFEFYFYALHDNLRKW
jgi:hypothetical protein